MNIPRSARSPRRMATRWGLILTLVAATLGSCFLFEEPPNGTDADALVEEALALMRQGDWEGALTKFSEALVIDPSHGQAAAGYATVNVASVATDQGAIVIDDQMRTTASTIYAIGDVTGKLGLAHVASAQGIIAAEAPNSGCTNIRGRNSRIWLPSTSSSRSR